MKRTLLLFALLVQSCTTITITVQPSYGNPKDFKESQQKNSDKVWKENKERVYNISPIIHAPNVDSLNKAKHKVLTASDFQQQ